MKRGIKNDEREPLYITCALHSCSPVSMKLKEVWLVYVLLCFADGWAPPPMSNQSIVNDKARTLRLH